jgi:hypothetical protein
MLNNGHWKFDKQMGDGVGFIYIIRDKDLRRFYLGKKSFKVGRGQHKGKDSGWRKYKTSSPIMKTLFEGRPLSDFEFICIEEYKTKGTLSYAETWTLCLVEAPTTSTFYNKRIEAVSWNVKEPISDKHKERLRQVINWEKV